MKRKVVKLGPATLVVSLPTKWIKSNKVEAGDEVELDEQGRSILIRSGGRKGVEKSEIDISNMPTLMKRYLVAKYIKGDEEIKINVNSLEKARMIQGRVDELIGMEVLEQKKNYLILKEMGGITEESFDSVLRRTMHLLQTLSDDLLEAVKKGETNLEYLEDVEKRINKFTDYCYRLLNKRGHTEYQKTPIMYCIVYLIELVSDEYERILEYITENKIKLNSKMIEVFEEVNEYHKQFNKLFFDFTVDGAVKLADKRNEIEKSINSALNKTEKKEEIILLIYLENINKLIIDIACEMLVFA